MLIQALSDYYDLLASEGQILPEGYSKVNIHYLICLTEEGKVDSILPYKVRQEVPGAKGKVKEKWVPKSVQMPERTEKPGIDGNVIEHRPLYIFGLNYEDGVLTPEDKTDKAKKSHRAFVEVNLNFTEGLDSPLIHAYRNFLNGWKPEEETENSILLRLGKEYGSSGYAFCLTGSPDILLHEDVLIKQRWEQRRQNSSKEEEACISQCAVSGEKAAIARIHSKIKGVYGGLATGSVLVGFNNQSEESYGREQSYNSNISQHVMKRYTEALNYLLEDSIDPKHGKHRVLLDDITIVFWAMKVGGSCEDAFMAMLYGQSDKMDEKATEHMLKGLLESGRKGKITEGRLQSLDKIDPDVDFYMLGLKPNSSRLAMKFLYRKKYADVLWNIARFQKDMQVSKELRPVSIWQIKGELVPPKSNSEKVNPAMIAKLFESIIYGTPYPVSLLETVVRRVKTDGDTGRESNRIRIGIIKAYLNRKNKKEEFGVALDKENNGQAYLCGRLFAVLEKLQQDASGNSLNRTIKDAYFASASSKPAMVFPKLLRLAQNHLNKVSKPTQVYHGKLMGEIMDKLKGEFPETLLLQDQGRFMIGYYQQYQNFFVKGEGTEGKRRDGSDEESVLVSDGNAENNEMEAEENGN
ncbi:MAG: type I-C CRISPR-associated protein Cas8c/Csd1 [Butyrivibrio sp.]|nr:type I-C CRISPR-associated protein Cas8c/Csd1 [Butyrivibrio sp.]MCM1343445.1 type I-C CRISPR-associated protein Cas8c/Csd1 [Muribaculaceae bacterium]